MKTNRANRALYSYLYQENKTRPPNNSETLTTPYGLTESKTLHQPATYFTSVDNLWRTCAAWNLRSATDRKIRRPPAFSLICCYPLATIIFCHVKNAEIRRQLRITLHRLSRHSRQQLQASRLPIRFSDCGFPRRRLCNALQRLTNITSAMAEEHRG